LLIGRCDPPHLSLSTTRICVQSLTNRTFCLLYIVLVRVIAEVVIDSVRRKSRRVREEYSIFVWKYFQDAKSRFDYENAMVAAPDEMPLFTRSQILEF
ncbi:hypothetical protein PENTCL1PPCAC_29004, partial [Pristionchus entomophagus]